MSQSTASFDINPLSPALGAEVRGIDLATISDADFAAVQAAWHENLVLVIRDQKISDEDFLSFSARLGALDLAPITVTGKPYIPELPHLAVISNVVEDGQAIGGLGNSELIWHTDMSYAENPPIASLLYSLEVPETGGDTWFCNMYKAYDSLPASLKQRIATLTCKHDSSHNSAGETRKGFADGFTSRDEIPGAVHPLVCQHPATGRPVLYLGRRENAYIVELPDHESEALLDEIWSHTTRPENSLRHHWRVGDILMWDNRCTMHRRDDFNQNTRRLMHRSQVKGRAMAPAYT
ncbi:MAG: TauD/TfdA family dioxygenase [Proteobacteria bacterium]|nr:TauD/TfdA family dioxygenase [Pseudomonadota bacterium]MDA1326478.1 TauD/TfdA family dioxygenase [Pseudomonadota bacterium]